MSNEYGHSFLGNSVLSLVRTPHSHYTGGGAGAAHTGRAGAVPPDAAPGGEGEMDAVAQPPRATQPPGATQQQPAAAATTTQVEPPPLFDQILQAYRAHDFDPGVSLQGDFVLSDGFWCKRDRAGSLRVVIPEDAKLQENILHELYDSRAHAHTGQRRTTVARYFWWPGMTGYVKLYIKHCHACQVMKAGNRKPAGLLRSLHP